MTPDEKRKLEKEYKENLKSITQMDERFAEIKNNYEKERSNIVHINTEIFVSLCNCKN